MEAQPIGDWTGSEHLPSAAFPRDIAAGEKVEAELDALVSRRHEQRVKAEEAKKPHKLCLTGRGDGS